MVELARKRELIGGLHMLISDQEEYIAELRRRLSTAEAKLQTIARVFVGHPDGHIEVKKTAPALVP